jgi:glutaredoxin
MLDENNYQYKLVDVETEVGKRSFEKIITITKSDHIPVVAVNSKILAPGHSFKTIDECFGLIQELVE